MSIDSNTSSTDEQTQILDEDILDVDLLTTSIEGNDRSDGRELKPKRMNPHFPVDVFVFYE